MTERELRLCVERMIAWNARQARAEMKQLRDFKRENGITSEWLRAYNTGCASTLILAARAMRRELLGVQDSSAYNRRMNRVS